MGSFPRSSEELGRSAVCSQAASVYLAIGSVSRPMQGHAVVEMQSRRIILMPHTFRHADDWKVRQSQSFHLFGAFAASAAGATISGRPDVTHQGSNPRRYPFGAAPHSWRHVPPDRGSSIAAITPELARFTEGPISNHHYYRRQCELFHKKNEDQLAKTDWPSRCRLAQMPARR